MRDGEFVIASAYKRKRIDYNIYDEIGKGHEIHMALFEDEYPEESRARANSTHGNLLDVKTKASDTVSLVSSNSSFPSIGRRGSNAGVIRKSEFPTMPRRSAFPTLPSNSSFQGTSTHKRKTSLTFRTTAKTLIAVENLKKDASMGAAFPVVPDSPDFIIPEPKLAPIAMRQVFD